MESPTGWIIVLAGSERRFPGEIAMTSALRIRCSVSLACALAAGLALSSTAVAAEKSDNAAAKSPDATDSNKPAVDLFDAMKSGDIDVKYVAKNSLEGQLLVKNNTDQPLTVKLPEAFAAVPVLAQQAAGTTAQQQSQFQQQEQSESGHRRRRTRWHRRRRWVWGRWRCVQRRPGKGRQAEDRHRLPRARQERTERSRSL